MACINRSIYPFLFRKSCLVVFCKKGVLKNFAKFTGKDLCQSVLLLLFAGLRSITLKKGTLAQVFSCQFCRNFINIFFYRVTPVAAYVYFYFEQEKMIFDAIWTKAIISTFVKLTLAEKKKENIKILHSTNYKCRS